MNTIQSRAPQKRYASIARRIDIMIVSRLAIANMESKARAAKQDQQLFKKPNA